MPPPTPQEPLVVLVADDDDDTRALVSAVLRAAGCSTIEARDGQELLDLLGEALDEPGLRPHVVVTDVRMPRLSGFGVLGSLVRARWKLPVVLMTAMSDESIQTIARRLGAASVLRKPFTPDALLAAVRNANSSRVSHA